MSRSNGKSISTDPKEILKWTERYARSRTIYFLIQWSVIVSIIFIIVLITNLAQQAYLSNNMPLFYISVVFLGFLFLFFLWVSTSKRMADLVWQVTLWFYKNEGYVLPTERRKGLPRWAFALIGLMIAYHILGAGLIFLRYLSIQNLQPFSAVVLVPVLFVLIYYQDLGFWAWLWPILYGIHAILLVVGFPVSFPKEWYILNIVVPVFGYGLLAILVGHAYNRYAWWRLKSLTNLREATNLSEESEEGDVEYQKKDSGAGLNE